MSKHKLYYGKLNAIFDAFYKTIEHFPGGKKALDETIDFLCPERIPITEDGVGQIPKCTCFTLRDYIEMVKMQEMPLFMRGKDTTIFKIEDILGRIDEVYAKYSRLRPKRVCDRRSYERILNISGKARAMLTNVLLGRV